MKQKQKKDLRPGLAYAFAIIAIFASFLLWTYFVAEIVAFTLWRTQTTVKFVNINIVDTNEPDELENSFTLFGHAAADTKTREIVVDIPKTASVIEPAIEIKEPEKETVLVEEEMEEIIEEEVKPEIIEEEESEADEWDLTLSYYLAIPDIGVNTEVFIPSMNFWNTQKWDLLEEQMQIGLNEGAVAYPHSAQAGDKGTVIIAGHSSPPTESAKQSGNGHLFARLPELTNGDKILIRRGEKSHIYEVEGTEIVASSETSILLQQNDASLMKLITCYPVGTTRDRYIITARLVGE